MKVLFDAQYQVFWSDCDMNGHMANSSYLDYGTQTRFRYITESGFTLADFQRHRVGPVIFEERIRYLRELKFLDHFRVDFSFEWMDEAKRKFRIVNRYFRGEEMAAELDVLGAWFDLDQRKVRPAPEALVRVFE